MVSVNLISSLAVFQLLLGDLLGGIIGCALAGAGQYSTTPQGVAWVPTYTVLTFINGSIGVLSLLEKMSFSRFPLFSLSNPLVVNVVHGIFFLKWVSSFKSFSLAVVNFVFLVRHLVIFAAGNPHIGIVTATPLLSFAGVYYAYSYLRELRCMNSNGTMIERPEIQVQGSDPVAEGPLDATNRPSHYVPFTGTSHTL